MSKVHWLKLKKLLIMPSPGQSDLSIEPGPALLTARVAALPVRLYYQTAPLSLPSPSCGDQTKIELMLKVKVLILAALAGWPVFISVCTCTAMTGWIHHSSLNYILFPLTSPPLRHSSCGVRKGRLVAWNGVRTSRLLLSRFFVRSLITKLHFN